MRRRRSRNGYVLLMTVVLIAIAGLFLAGIARHSLSLALSAQQSQEELQRRWSDLSCQQAILLNADHILEQLALDNQAGNAVSSGNAARVSTRFMLGDTEVDLLLADESAKVSLNTIYRRQGKEGVSRLIRQESNSGGILTLHLRPYRTNSNTGDFPAFDSWGQVFSLARSESGNSIAAGLAGATEDLTCWGGGRLNLERASNAAVEHVCRLAVTDRTMRELLELRKQRLVQLKQDWLASASKSSASDSSTKISQPDEAVDSSATERQRKRWLPELLDELSLREGERKQLNELLTDRSDCCSLWITIRSKQRSWHRLCLANSTGDMKIKCWSFCW